MNAQHWPILIVVIPMLTAPLMVLVRHAGAAWALFALASAASFVLALATAGYVSEHGVISYAVGGWEPPFGIEYRVDGVNALVLCLVSGMATVVAPLARGSIAREIPGRRIYLFYACLLLNLTGLLGMAATGDAFNVFVFLEISSLSGYALIAMGARRAALLASFQYLIMGTIGGTFFLTGVGLLYAVTGTLNMADLAGRLPMALGSNVLSAAMVFIVIGLGIKIALFPLHAWLPGAYTQAPSAVSLFMASTATKVAAYVLLRMLVTVLPPLLVFQALPLADLLLVTACIAMLVGSAVAIVQTDYKRLLAYSSIGQMGYIVLGIALGSAAGTSASLLHMVNHGVIKGALFAIAAVLAWRLGTTRIDDLAGLARRMPWVFAVLVIAGLGIIGVPGTAGFVSKWALVQALIADARWIAVAAVLVSSLLAVIYMGRLIEVAVFRDPPTTAKPDPLPAGFVITLAVLAVGVIALGLHGAALVDFTEAAAAALTQGMR